MEEASEHLPESHKKWLLLFLPLAWSGHVGLGLALGVFGPTQPYIAKNVEVEADTINFIWTGRSIGFCITCVITAMVFKKFFTATWQKLGFLAISEVITGSFVMATPWVSSFPMLIAMVTAYGMGLGFFDTADNSLMVYMLGPRRSRPFTQSLHAFVGVGFVIGSFLVQPFLPKENDGESSLSVCPGANSSSIAYTPDIMGGIPSINWPYIIIAVWHFITALGMIILGWSGLKMPSYYSENSSKDSNQQFTQVKYWKLLLVMIYFYYVFSCGLEGFFQSMTYTYGLCGPLKMSPKDAAFLNSVYLGAFVIGRCSGIFISKLFTPVKIIIISLSGCLLSSILLLVVGSWSTTGIYIGAGLMGFAISFQFASGYSWTADLFNVTGNLSFIFFLGGFSGFLSFPPTAGAIFSSDNSDKMGVFYLALSTTIVHSLLFIAMVAVSRIKTQRESQSEMEPLK